MARGLALGGVGTVVPGEDESDSRFAVANEEQVVLDSDLDVDIASPGNFTNESQLSGGTVASGTEVSSYIAHFDSVGQSLTTKYAGLTFSQGLEVVGLIVEDSTLDQTDSLVGTDRITYPSADATDTRGLELQNDDVIFGADNRSVWIHAEAQNGVDQVRILVTDK